MRKADCSGQFLDRAEDSDFWKMMQKYKVDVYFAGEVHANTVSKDDKSDLLQVVTRGNRINNYLTVSVTEDGFSMKSYNEYGRKWRFNGKYEEYGSLVVDKSGDRTSIEGSGSLELVDISKGPLIQINFENDDLYPLHRRQVVGMKYDQYQESLSGTSITIRNITSVTGMKNLGVFGRKYYVSVIACAASSMIGHHN